MRLAVEVSRRCAQRYKKLVFGAGMQLNPALDRPEDHVTRCHRSGSVTV